MTLDEMIVSLIQKQVVSDHDDLRSLLKKRGFDVTQSTLSRHLKKLGAEKRNGRYTLAQSPREMMGEVSCVLAPPNLILLKTLPGHAHALAYQLDHLDLNEIAGSVAGDDTVLIALKDPKFLKDIQKKLEHVFCRG